MSPAAGAGAATMDLEAGTSRRALLAGSCAGAAMLLSACSKGGSRPKVHKIPSPSRATDIQLLNHALDLEHRAIAAYTAGIPLLDHSSQAAAKVFLTQELDHAGELAGLIKQAGGKGVKPAASYDFGAPRSTTDVLRLLHRIERAQIAAYMQMLASLSPGSVRAAVAAVLSNDAQHIALLRSRLRIEPASSAFVTGNE